MTLAYMINIIKTMNLTKGFGCGACLWYEAMPNREVMT